MNTRTLWILPGLAVLLLAGCGGAKRETATPAADGTRSIVFTMRTEEGSRRNESLIHGIEQAARKAPAGVTLTYKKLPKPDETAELMQFKSGVYADFNWNTQSDIGWMSATGLIQPVDWIKDLDCFTTMPASVLEKVTYKGHVYAIPFDCVMTMNYLNRRALKALGWDDAKMARLPGQVARGEFTLQDLSSLCQESLGRKTVKYGFLMLGVEWNTLFALSSAFNARSYDRAAEKLVVPEKEWLDYLGWWYAAINESKIVPKGLPGMAGESVAKILLNAETMDYMGYDGYRTMCQNWRKDAKGAKDDSAFQAWFDSSWLMTLPPSGIRGRPATTQMKVFVMFVSSKTSQEKLGYLKDILNAMYAPDVQAQTNVNNLSIPVTRNVLEDPAVKAIPYIGEAAQYIDVADAWASHPYFHQYLIHHKKAIESMIVDGSTARAAFNKLKEELTYNVDKQSIVFTPQ